MANYIVNYTVTVDDAPEIVQALKDLLDNQLDPDNAGGNYAARGKEQFKLWGTRGMRQKLRAYRSNEAVTTMRSTQDAINADTDVGDGVDN